MKTASCWRGRRVLGLGLVLGSLVGCQTWVPEAGVTLPSGRYIQHPPQYLPPSPGTSTSNANPMSLPNELQSMNRAAAAGAGNQPGGIERVQPPAP